MFTFLFQPQKKWFFWIYLKFCKVFFLPKKLYLLNLQKCWYCKMGRCVVVRSSSGKKKYKKIKIAIYASRCHSFAEHWSAFHTKYFMNKIIIVFLCSTGAIREKETSSMVMMIYFMMIVHQLKEFKKINWWMSSLNSGTKHKKCIKQICGFSFIFCSYSHFLPDFCSELHTQIVFWICTIATKVN